MQRREFVNITCCCAVYAILAGTLSKKIFYDKKDGLLDYIEVHLLDHCNLNCKYCSHFSPIADENYYDIDKFQQDFQQLSKATGKKIKTIRLMGGEPLLNREINTYIEISRKYFPHSAIHILTNGTLLTNKKEDFWKCLRKNKIYLEISNYPININPKKIYNTAFKYGIKTSIINIEGENSTEKVYEFDKLNLDLKAKQKDLMHCKTCFTGGCLNLYEGKIFACPVIAYIKYFNKKFNQNIEVSASDYLDIYKIKNVEEIINWSNEPKQFCKYCAPTVKRKWEVSNKHEIEEWII